VYAVTVEKGQRGRVGRFLNGNVLVAGNGQLAWRPLIEEVTRVRC
jgi:hypothetical protein